MNSGGNGSARVIAVDAKLMGPGSQSRPNTSHTQLRYTVFARVAVAIEIVKRDYRESILKERDM